MEYQTIIVEKNNAVGYLTLNRPERYNSLTIQMSEEIVDALKQWKDDDQVKVIVIQAAGKAFCTGQEISPELFSHMPIDLGEVIEKYTYPIIELVVNTPKVFICAVNGVAAGAGASLALLCDMTIAAKSAGFTQIFSKIGLVPDCGATWYLPRMIGFAKAKALMLTAEKITADEAERLGMLYKVVEDEQLQQEVITLAEHMATQATLSYGLIKQALLASLQNDLTTQLALERDLQRQAGQSEDFMEAARAFLMKDTPNFKGR